jgi:hypothetical protein
MQPLAKEGSSSFLKKRTKKLLFSPHALVHTMVRPSGVEWE